MTAPVTQQPWTIGRLLNWTADYLTQRAVDEPRLTAEVLLAQAVTCRRIELYTRFDEVLAADPLARFRSLVKRAADHEPAAYLVGEKEFYSLPFFVTPAVLIPRPETETLVESAIELLSATEVEHPSILDLGTGSGCIAVALAKQLPEARIVGTDVSPDALAVARSNVERNFVSDRVTLIEADRLNLPPETVPPGGFDLLVSNPPYVAVAAMTGLDRTVQAFEPSIALTDGDDGLSFYRCIASEGATVVKLAGHVIVEVADGQADAVVDALVAGHAWTHVRTMKDRVTRLQRVVIFQKTC